MPKGVTGVNQVIAELRKFGKDAEKMINYETEAAAFEIAKNAKTLAPKNFGKLAQSISVSQPISDRGKALSTMVVTVNEVYGAYMEFGTGTKVKVPDEFKNMAATFQGSTGKSWREGLEAIKIWCKAKGIDEKAAYPIFAKILGAGVNPQPFLYPAWTKGKSDYLKNLKRLLNNYNKKI
jgi:HK97 gp10 family phage protein